MAANLNPAEKAEGLPEPWLRQFDSQYGCYFYIDPSTTPPTVSWVHPLEKDGAMHPEQIEVIKHTLDQELQAEGHPVPPPYDPNASQENPYLQQQPPAEQPKRKRNYGAADGQLLEKMGKPVAEVEAEERARRAAEARQQDPAYSRGMLSSALGAALMSGGGRPGMGGMGMMGGGMGGGGLGMLLGSTMGSRPSRYSGAYNDGYYSHSMGPPPFGMYSPMMGGGMGGMGMMGGGHMGGMGMMGGPMGGMGMMGGPMGMGGGMMGGRMGGMGMGMGSSPFGMLAPLLMGGMAGGMMGSELGRRGSGDSYSDREDGGGYDGGFDGGDGGGDGGFF